MLFAHSPTKTIMRRGARKPPLRAWGSAADLEYLPIIKAHRMRLHLADAQALVVT